MAQLVSMGRCCARPAAVNRQREKIDLHHSGQYSLERLVALQQYTSTRSLTHAAFVSFTTVTHPLIAIVFLDALPLQDASDGWDGNPTLWSRLAIITIDAMHNCLSLYRLFGMMKEVQELVNKDFGNDDLLSYVPELAKDPDKLDSGLFRKFRAGTCAPLQLKDEAVSIVYRMHAAHAKLNAIVKVTSAS